MVESLQSFWEYFQKQLDNDSFTEALFQHATYVVLVTISATVISVSLGVAVRRRPVAREVALGKLFCNAVRASCSFTTNAI